MSAYVLLNLLSQLVGGGGGWGEIRCEALKIAFYEQSSSERRDCAI